MSNFTVLTAVSATLRSLLWADMEFDSVITGVPPILSSDTQISNEPPFVLMQNNEPDQNVLSVYLYRIEENPDRKNRPPELQADGLLHRAPLSLNLYYLVTPLTSSTSNDHLLLGKVLQIFHDQGIIKGSQLAPLLRASAEELRLSLQQMSMDEITQLWFSFQRAYRLSVCYQVKVVYIDSQVTMQQEPVVRKRLEFVQVKEAT